MALLKYVGETVGCFNAVTGSKEHELFERLEELSAEHGSIGL